MLDLASVFGNHYYEMKLFDGREVKLLRPTQGMFQTILDLKKVADDNNEQEAWNGLLSIFLAILNRNVEGIEFKLEDITEDYNLNVISYVIGDYFSYWEQEVSQRVNFQDTQQ